MPMLMIRSLVLAFAGALIGCTAAPTPGLSRLPTNSLGMAFVPLHVAGSHRTVEFCIHETRERDLCAFTHLPTTHPERAATQVNWHQATAFCTWLTNKEHAEGRLSPARHYRLPTDHEWSSAAGIGELENPAQTPEQKRRKISGVYPWGNAWPPGRKDGNYFGRESPHHEGDTIVPGRGDGRQTACEVMHYKPNAHGLYDLGGNVWEWCADEFRTNTDWRVLRGAAWNCSRPEVLLSSHRPFDPPTYQSDTVGFRIVRE